MTKEEADEKLTGAREHFCKHRGQIMIMGDGSIMTISEYNKFRVHWIMVGLGLRKES